MRRNSKQYILVLLSAILLCGCAKESRETAAEAVGEQTESVQVGKKSQETEIAQEEAALNVTETEQVSEEDSTESRQAQEEQVLDFVDAFGKGYQVSVNPSVAKHSYKMECFAQKEGKKSYQGDERYSYRLGVDVSHHEGDIDWQKVREDGIEFAIIRIGYRGYGQEGKICLDKKFADNIRGAQNAGLDVGVYFFAQAVNEEEAREEAEFVLTHLKGYQLQLPVVYDPESILDAPARTDDVTGEQFTKNTKMFCELMEEAGYQPMIYSNMLWEAYQLDLTALEEYPIWYADYEMLPQTPYHFSFWQYTNEGSVNGIGKETDLDIQLIQK